MLFLWFYGFPACVCAVCVYCVCVYLFLRVLLSEINNKQAVGERTPRYAPALSSRGRRSALRRRAEGNVAAVSHGYLCANFCLPIGLSVLDLGPMYATDRQTADKRQTRIIA